MSGQLADVLNQAAAWLAQDPDEETRHELETLVSKARSGDEAAIADLHSRFDERLAFGTAGLRGELAAGPNRMNRVLVAQAAAGLAAYLLEASPHQRPSVVIGYDGRKNSRVFATDTAELMAGAGIRAILLPRLLPTPLVAFAVRALDVSAGVMVTASHNPPMDNGYKVYLGGVDEGSQIVPPADTEIAAHILRVAAEQNVLDLPRGTDYEVADESVIRAYIEQTAAIIPAPRTQPTVVYTAMHGVGWETARQVFRAAGFDEPAIVPEQIEPDATFPTVAFPNPEEPGALDLAFRVAREVEAELVIANDPDADRLAVAIPDPNAPDGYRRLSGNEVGTLLGWHVAEQIASSGESTHSRALACSLVSTPALGAIAESYGFQFRQTLTGFKWVSRVPGLVFGFEEALGYLVDPSLVRDKDGISAAVAFLSMASELKAQGMTIAERLEQFSETFGHYASEQISIRVAELSQIGQVMARLRLNPPREIGNVAVRQIDDLTTGSADLPASDVLRIWLEDGSRVIVRPSGTEPKLKVYIDCSSVDGTVTERRAAASEAVARLSAAMTTLVG